VVPQRTCVRDWVLSQQLGDCGRVGHITCLLLIALSLFLLLPFESPAGHRQELAAKKTLCYAFLRHGDIWTVCEGKREQIHIGRDLLDFAISSDGTFLAYLIDTPELRRKGLFRYLASKPQRNKSNFALCQLHVERSLDCKSESESIPRQTSFCGNRWNFRLIWLSAAVPIAGSLPA